MTPIEYGLELVRRDLDHGDNGCDEGTSYRALRLLATWTVILWLCAWPRPCERCGWKLGE